MSPEWMDTIINVAWIIAVILLMRSNNKKTKRIEFLEGNCRDSKFERKYFKKEFTELWNITLKSDCECYAKFIQNRIERAKK